MPICNNIGFYDLYKGSSQASPLCMTIPTQRLRGRIQSPLDWVGVFPLMPGGLKQALLGWLLNTRGSKSTAAPRLHSSGIQLQGGERRIRTLCRYAVGKGPGNANQAPDKSSPGRSHSIAVAVLRVAASLTIPAEWDAGPYGKKIKGNCFGMFFFPHGNAECILWTRYGCKVVMSIFPFLV